MRIKYGMYALMLVIIHFVASYLNFSAAYGYEPTLIQITISVMSLLAWVVIMFLFNKSGWMLGFGLLYWSIFLAVMVIALAPFSDLMSEYLHGILLVFIFIFLTPYLTINLKLLIIIASAMVIYIASMVVKLIKSTKY